MKASNRRFNHLEWIFPYFPAWRVTRPLFKGIVWCLWRVYLRMDNEEYLDITDINNCKSVGSRLVKPIDQKVD